MNRILSIALLTSAPWLLGAAPLPPRQDLLRFVNGDQLHGSFQGFKADGAVVWQREDLATPSEFKSDQLQKVILRAGFPEKANEALSHVALVNGDRIPGTIIGLDEEVVTIDTSFAGIVKLPRNQVAMVAPMPFGGIVSYHGPYSTDGWLMTNTKYPDGIPDSDPETATTREAEEQDPVVGDEGDAGDAGDDEAVDGEKSKTKESPIPRWDFSGSAWYWNQKQAGTALIRKSGLGDRSILKFNLAWRSRLMVSVAFHADFSRPAEPEPEDGEDAPAANKHMVVRPFSPGDISLFPRLFGNSYVLQFQSGSAMMLRCGFDADGNPAVERLQVNNSYIRLPETGSADFEIRCDREKGTITLYVEGKTTVQWDEPGLKDEGDYAGKGGGLGFLVQMPDSPVRISDIVIAKWNGMPDSARSMQSDDQDIVLLVNGTDRFSGNITGFRDGKVRLHGQFGDFVFPIKEVAEIRFASNRLSEIDAFDDASDGIVVRLNPIGNITGVPVSGDVGSLRLMTSYAGELKLMLESAVTLDFKQTNNFLDDWDSQF